MKKIIINNYNHNDIPAFLKPKKHTYSYRVAHHGAGVVILPEGGNNKETMTDHELKKALHLLPEQETKNKPYCNDRVTNTVYCFTDNVSDDTKLIKLTDDQLRVFEWLSDNGYYDDFTVEPLDTDDVEGI